MGSSPAGSARASKRVSRPSRMRNPGAAPYFNRVAAPVNRLISHRSSVTKPHSSNRAANTGKTAAVLSARPQPESTKLATSSSARRDSAPACFPVPMPSDSSSTHRPSSVCRVRWWSPQMVSPAFLRTALLHFMPRASCCRMRSTAPCALFSKTGSSSCTPSAPSSERSMALWSPVHSGLSLGTCRSIYSLPAVRQTAVFARGR